MTTRKTSDHARAAEHGDTVQVEAYVVEWSMVGNHFRGEVIRIDEDHRGDVDIERLLSIGAIRPASAADGSPTPWGIGTQNVPQPFPPVPHDAQKIVMDVPLPSVD